MYQYLCAGICVPVSVCHICVTYLCTSVCVPVSVYKCLCTSICVPVSVYQYLCAVSVCRVCVPYLCTCICVPVSVCRICVSVSVCWHLCTGIKEYISTQECATLCSCLVSVANVKISHHVIFGHLVPAERTGWLITC